MSAELADGDILPTHPHATQCH